jgi:hypothetical protein
VVTVLEYSGLVLEPAEPVLGLLVELLVELGMVLELVLELGLLVELELLMVVELEQLELPVPGLDAEEMHLTENRLNRLNPMQMRSL